MASPSGFILVHRAADDTEIARFYAPKRAEVVLQQLHVVGQLKTEDGVVLADGDILEAGTYKFYDAPGVLCKPVVGDGWSAACSALPAYAELVGGGPLICSSRRCQPGKQQSSNICSWLQCTRTSTAQSSSSSSA